MELAVNNSRGFNLTPSSLEEAFKLAEIMANSEMVSKDFRGKPGNVLIAVQMGAEVGLPPMQAIQNIAVINGRPSLWGDAIKAVILGSPLCEVFEEGIDEANMTAWVRVKRKNHTERIVSFSKADAEQAGLWSKPGPWTQYPKRMLQMRARAFAARDEFADLLRGLSVAEEVRDFQVGATGERDITPSSQIQESEPPALPDLPQSYFDKKLPGWTNQISQGRTALDVITTMETKYTVSEEQKGILNSIEGGNQ